MSKWNINWTRLCSNVVAFACVILSLLLEVTLCKCSSTGRPLGAYNLRVAAPRALVYAGLMTSGDASASRPAATPRGGGTGGQVDRGGRRVREHMRRNVKPTSEPEGQGNNQGVEVHEGGDGVLDFSMIIAQQLQNLLPTMLAQVGNQGSNQGDNRNQSCTAVHDNIWGDVRNVIVNNGRRDCTYEECLDCNPKEYDGKGGAIVYTHWIEKMESVQDMSRCRDDQKVKYTAGSFVGKALMWWNSQIHIRIHEVVVSMTWDDFKIRGTVATKEPKTIQKTVQIAGTLIDEAIRNGSLKKNPEKRGNGGEHSKDKNGRDDNKRTRTGNAFATTTNPVRRENTSTTTKLRGQGKPSKPSHGNNGNQTHGRAFMLGAEEARQDLNIVTGIDPSDLGFIYETEIASGQLVEIDKVIKGCKLEIEGHKFDINLIPFGIGSFDMIIGMDWLSNHKAEIIFHEKVVRIPLPDDKVLRVQGERTEEKMRHLVSSKAKEQKQEELVVVRDFLEVFSDDLSGLPPSREIKFRIELVLGAVPVMKSPYQLAPSEMEELSGQLKEL
ncbi:putative reverse transcriptase domain-containing protein [Tanacetum coccineum]